MNDSSRPLWVQGDRTVLFEVDHPLADEVQHFLPRFAELEKSPERFHTYRITPLSLWNAAAVGVGLEEILDFLDRMSRYATPSNVVVDIREFLHRYGLLSLYRRDGQLVLESREPELLGNLSASSVIEEYVLGRTEDGAVLLKEEARGEVKQALLRVGYPVEDLAGYTPGAPYPFSLKSTTAAGQGFSLRRYQEQSANLFHAGGSERGGSGVIVLPCGAGKTVVAMAVMDRVQAQTLVLTTNTVAVRQWKSELLDKSNVPAEDIGEYTGARKEIRPITISTYQILTHRRKKGVTPFTHFGLFNANDWGLIVYDEVHLLPAPVFRATADLQARRRLGLTATLVREDQREEDVFSLIGPKRFDMPWKDLERQGWIATAECVEVRVPLPQKERLHYLSLPPRDRFRVASENPEKLVTLQQILELHKNDLVLVIGQYLQQIEGLAAAVQCPIITGKTPVKEREQLYRQFRHGELRVLVVSKVGNFAIDLPDANVAVQVSGTFGSRQEEAQRLGRILRPKSSGAPATFYSLVSRDTKEEEYGQKRQRYLTERGYSYRICGPSELGMGGLPKAPLPGAPIVPEDEVPR
jgi:DNA excision repair protein ERCC-3